MKSLYILWICFVLIGCSSNKRVAFNTGDTYNIKYENKTIVSIIVPDGDWGARPSSIDALERGWIEITGQPGNSSPFGYAVDFTITPAKRYGENITQVLKTQDFSAYAKKINTWSTPEAIAEMKAENYGQGLILLNGFSCRNSWYQQKLAPQINNGNGVPVFISFVACPLVIDGQVFSFEVGTNSGIRPAYLQWETEYNKDKKPEDQIRVDTYHHLSHLGDKVLQMFNNIQFHGKVSQDYSDIINPIE